MSISCNENINFVYGKLPEKPKIRIIFDKLVVEFLNALSIIIAKDKSINQYEDLKTFGFWCRRKNNLKSTDNQHSVDPYCTTSHVLVDFF